MEVYFIIEIGKNTHHIFQNISFFRNKIFAVKAIEI